MAEAQSIKGNNGMMYRNRMLVAQEDLHLGTDYVTKGADFSATDTDADYLIGQKKAVEQQGATSPTSVTAAPAGLGLQKIAETVRETPGSEALRSLVAPNHLEADPESRDELLQKAEALGLKVDGRWSTNRLSTELAALEPKA